MNLGPLTIKVHGYSRPDSNDYLDGNWLTISAECVVHFSSAHIDGMIHGPELAHWYRELRRINKALEGTATLHGMEPGLQVSVTLQPFDPMLVEVVISQDSGREERRFYIDLEPDQLNTFIFEMDSVLKKYPLKGLTQ